MMDNYEKQAIDFLEQTGTTLQVAFDKYAKHFDDDELPRDIYTVTLKRGKARVVIQFGQALDCSFNVDGFNELSLADKRKVFKMLGQNSRDRSYTFFAHAVSGRRGALLTLLKQRREPAAYDVLTCLTKYNPGRFEDFCADFGYGIDSRKAERIYNSVVQEWLQVSSMFSESELEMLREIN